MLLLLRFFHSSEVAIRVVSQGGRAMEAWCDFFVQEKRKFFILNKEFEKENKLVSRII